MFASKIVKVAAALIFAAIGCAAGPAAAADQVSVQLDWVVRGNHAMFFVGKVTQPQMALRGQGRELHTRDVVVVH